LDRVDYATININTNNTDEYQEQLINDLRNSDKEPVKHYLEMVDYLIKYREGETLQNAIDDIQDISIVNYDDHPLAAYFTKLCKQIHSSFLKSLEIVAARIPAQSM
jgi:Na+-transporting NADH:ubiquinone oxidoreductase subunit NqrA